MPRYHVTFSDVRIREMYVESESEEKLFQDYKDLTPEMEGLINTAVEVDGYYDREIIIKEVEDG